MMFHMSMWRERLRHALNELAEARPQPAPPRAASTRSTTRSWRPESALRLRTPRRGPTLFLSELIAVHEKLGEKPMEWSAAKTTTEAVLRNSYIHPRNHMFAYLKENGDEVAAHRLFEDAEAAMRDADAPPLIRAIAMYNLAGVRAAQGRDDDAFELLAESLRTRPDMRTQLARDADFSSLHRDARFEELLKA